MTNPRLTIDLDHILSHTKDVWEELRDCRIFITGGTGFFGCWLLESFVWANHKFQLGASAVVLSRDFETARKKIPHLAANPAIEFHYGDVRNFTFPKGKFSYIIHAAATSAVATFNNEDALIKFDTVVTGTRRVLEFAVHSGARKILYTSSGAVYGRQPKQLTHMPETYSGAPNQIDISSAWGESKRAAEFLCTYYAHTHGLEMKIARCFSFIGPYLQQDIHYAAGNFIRDALTGGPIIIKGNGTPVRSYLYAADLMIWLWNILAHGKQGCAYNVGSENGISIVELAHKVAGYSKASIPIYICSKAQSLGDIDRYVPDTILARNHLGLHEYINIDEAIKRTFAWSKAL